MGALWALVPFPWRVGLVLGAALALLATGAWGGYRARGVRAQQELAEGLRQAVRERDRAIEDDSRVALALAGVRRALEENRGAIEGALAAAELSKETVYVVDGKKVTCINRDYGAYRRLYDQAVRPPPAPAAGVVP